MQITSETVRGRVESDHAVIGFKQERLREPENVERIFEEIAAALPDRGLRVLVLDFAGVMSVASNFLGKLVMLHSMMVDSMKCKQTTDLKYVESLRVTLEGFKAAYEGKAAQAH